MAMLDGSHGVRDLDIIINALGVQKSYGKKRALDGVNLSIRRGEAVAIIGPNGAGKTTLMEVLMGLRDFDAGAIQVFGHDMEVDANKVQRRLGIQLQDSVLVPRATVKDYLNLMSALYGADRARAFDIAEEMGLANCLRQPVGKLSGGQRQKLMLTLSLIGDPEIIFLDEPTTGLDPIARRELWSSVEKLKSDGRTLLFVTHYMEEVEHLCSRVVVVAGARIVADGSPQQVAEQVGSAGAKLDDIYGDIVALAGVEHA